MKWFCGKYSSVKNLWCLSSYFHVISVHINYELGAILIQAQCRLQTNGVDTLVGTATRAGLWADIMQDSVIPFRSTSFFSLFDFISFRRVLYHVPVQTQWENFPVQIASSVNTQWHYCTRNNTFSFCFSSSSSFSFWIFKAFLSCSIRSCFAFTIIHCSQAITDASFAGLELQKRNYN